MKSKLQAVEEHQEGGGVNKGREQREGCTCHWHPQELAGGWCWDKMQNGKEKIVNYP